MIVYNVYSNILTKNCVFRLSLFTTLTTLACLALTSAIDPGMELIASSPLHNGSYSGCTKKITNNDPQKNSISTLYNI